MRYLHATRRHLLPLIASAAAMLLTASTTAAAAQGAVGSRTSVDHGDITFSVLGDVGNEVGSRVTRAELSLLGITVAPGNTPQRADPHRTSSAQAVATNNVLFRWNDYGNREVVLRSQPYAKILTKHNLTYRTPRVVTQRATSRSHDGGQAWRYRLAAKEIRCDFWGNNCKVIRTVWVRTVVDFRAYQGDKYGVVTAYCEGYDGPCPDFVKNALNQ